jgi:hypothetical protein
MHGMAINKELGTNGFGASLVANGVADTGLVQWVIGLFRKKREEAE